MNAEEKFFMQQGWECPKCHTVNAPWMMTCGGCVKNKLHFDQVWGDKTHMPSRSHTGTPLTVNTMEKI